MTEATEGGQESEVSFMGALGKLVSRCSGFRA